MKVIPIPAFYCRIAVGTHEVCIFDATTVSDNGCSFTTYYKNIKSLIVCMAWHPEEEILAFGTMEGRVRVGYSWMVG